MIPFILSDAGRKAWGIPERRDCTVRAVATAFGVEYIEAHTAMKRLGRKDKRGVVFTAYAQRVAKELGSDLELVRLPEWSGSTLYRFIWSPDNKQGTFLVCVRGHAFAVVDRNVVDDHAQGERRIIKNVWRVRAKNTLPTIKLFEQQLDIAAGK